MRVRGSKGILSVDPEIENLVACPGLEGVKCGTRARQRCAVEGKPGHFEFECDAGHMFQMEAPMGTIRLRPSMIKFNSKNTKMEVHEPAVCKPCHLHRQLVRLLSDRGVPFGVFEALQKQMTSEMDAALGGAHAAADEAAAAAVRLLLRQGARNPRDVGSHPCHPALHVALQMLRDGWPVEEPFLASVLLAVRHKLVQSLLTKCRIHEPRGALIKGVVDEHNVLHGGSIFVQISNVRARAGAEHDTAWVQSSGLTFDANGSARVVGLVALVKVRCLPPPGQSAYAVDMPCVMHVHRTCMCMCVHACRRRAFIRVTYASSALSTRRSYAIITTSWSSHSTVCRRTTGPTRCVPHACMSCAQLPPHARCQKVHAWHVHAVAPPRPHRTISDLGWRPTPRP